MFDTIKDGWTMKYLWDDRNRPRTLIVSISSHFWALTKQDRKQSYRELQEAMDHWIAELEEQIRH